MQERRWEQKLHAGKGDGSQLKRRLQNEVQCMRYEGYDFLLFI
jgi:hypothetical protein